MEKWILFGVGFGIVVCMFIFGEGSPEFTCDPGQTQIQFCVREGEIDYTSGVNLDETLIGYFTESSNNGDDTGFSLDKNLVLNLSAYLSLSPNSYGVRLYPGQEGTRKFVLIKPLNSNGYELPDVGAAIEVRNFDLDGPCPRWCGQNARIIIEP